MPGSRNRPMCVLHSCILYSQKPPIPARVGAAAYIKRLTPKNIDVYAFLMEKDMVLAFQGFSNKSYDKSALLCFPFLKIQNTLKNQDSKAFLHSKYRKDI